VACPKQPGMPRPRRAEAAQRATQADPRPQTNQVVCRAGLAGIGEAGKQVGVRSTQPHDRWLQGTVRSSGSRAIAVALAALLPGRGLPEVQPQTRRPLGWPARAGCSLVLYIHQSIRDDRWTCSALVARHERDLFPPAVAVSGVLARRMAWPCRGPWPTEELGFGPIVQADLRPASPQPPAWANALLERLSVELRSKPVRGLRSRLPRQR